MTDLKPCPFCGGKAETTLGPIPGKWGTRCKVCDVWRDDRVATEAEAIAAWNSRTVQAQIDAAVEAERERCAKVADVRADLIEDAIKWGGGITYLTSLKGGLIELRNNAAAIRKGDRP